MALQWLEIFYDLNAGTSNRRYTGKPPWDGNIDNKKTWHFVDQVEYYFNVETISVGEYYIYVQFGRNDFPTWGSTRFMKYHVMIKELEKRDDNSITFESTIDPIYFSGRPTDGSKVGYPVNYKLSVGSTTFDSFQTNTVSTLIKHYNNVSPITVTDTIAPESTSSKTSIHVSTVYPGGQYDNRSYNYGIGVRNPLSRYIPYVPMAIRRGTWRALNTHPKGFIKRRVSGQWTDYSTEQEQTMMKVGQGHNRIRQDGWRQLPPMR